MLTQLVVKGTLFTGYPERSAVDAGHSPAGPHTHPPPPRPHTESPVIPAVQHRRTTAWTWCKGPGITKRIPNRMTGLDVCPVQRILKWKWLILSGRRLALPCRWQARQRHLGQDLDTAPEGQGRAPAPALTEVRYLNPSQPLGASVCLQDGENPYAVQW